MRTTITIDDDLLNELRAITGITRTSELVRKALLQLRQHEAGRRLIALGGSDPKAWAPNEGEPNGK